MFNVEQILFCPVPFGEARRACGPGALPWMSGKNLAGLHSVGQGPAGLDLLPTPADFYITSGSAIVPEGPEPGLGERRGRCLWARGQEGGRELHWLCQPGKLHHAQPPPAPLMC